ncbi:hypothetical protein VOLCADRAFT_121779 [Volvox carteri f. nagariensis]|uniref:EGF-like domain-containing protein n=1 Tax=Volvox carteri f. nagariensis TaxID=3068 RepID=D8UKE9_VOLCA|nr:uncharacterized protein VOLCADRAFT_121779 [Volvox carteri f. nagariensis]EFJ39797.1 hypothetical protein VOLCADRAFT_121779 [Volvox carteri f. nagariensis]|eukprot:XP_002959133.1 hypothetical protein VOLCADRAFT_121779 [Volvox carteri f. nagariensis]
MRIVCAVTTVASPTRMKLIQRWLSPCIFILVMLIAYAEGSNHDYFEELWGLEKSANQRNARRMLTRDLNMDEIFRYWQKMYGHWPTATYERHVQEYQRRVASAGRSWGLPKTDEDFLDIYYYLRSKTKVPHAPGWTPELDKCGPTCHMYGTCNQELAIPSCVSRCGCPRGREGPNCSSPVATSCHQYCHHEGQCHRIIREWCINECNDRGTCVGGVCHCYPGYFGADCSLSIDYEGTEPGSRGKGSTVVLAGLNYTANPRGPRIYIYEFPPYMHMWGMLWLDRPLNIIVWERIISMGLREVDPARADYFFIPGCGRGCDKWDDKFHFILAHYGQYWTQNQGRDHIMTHPGDWGRCEHSWDAFADKFISNVTMLQHWGMTVDRSSEVEHNLFNTCHKPNQDILVPPMCGDLYPQFEYNIWHPNRKENPITKTNLASVAGSICGWNSVEEPPCRNRYYSLGVRAALWQLRDVPGFHIAKRVAMMGQSMAESEFCFAPTGAGYGKRNVMATTLGCMPVIISDHVAQPYEPFLNWNEFGVWIPESQAKDVEIILRGFTPQQKAEKMEKLYCAARHLAFTTVYGGLFEGDTGEFDAMATLVHILRARKRHWGVPDHKLIEVDPEFADFMACKHRDISTEESGFSGSGGGGAPPPAPPLPLAGVTTSRSHTIDDEAFPQRTVTTVDWIRAANGEAAGRGQGSDGPVEPRLSGLCYFNPQWVHYADHDAADATDQVIKEHMKAGQCMPKNANRVAGFPPGASVTCPPTGPITKCAQLV